MEGRISRYCREREEGYTAGCGHCGKLHMTMGLRHVSVGRHDGPTIATLRGEGRRVGLPLKAIEVGGTIDEQRRLRLDEPLPIVGPSRVRVIILIPEEAGIDEKEWLQAAAGNPAIDFLKEPEEDVYTPADCDSRRPRTKCIANAAAMSPACSRKPCANRRPTRACHRL